MTAARKLATALALGAALTAAVVLTLGPSAAFAAEAPCLNEALRAESNVNPTTGKPYSQQLPDCRAYELVSPPDTHSASVAAGGNSAASPEANSPWLQITPDGSVYWIAKGAIPGTGVPPNGNSLGVYVSRRSGQGWATHGLTPFSSPGGSSLIAGSVSGSTAFISTAISLDPEDLDGLSMLNESPPSDIYRVSEGEAPQFVSHGTLPRTATNGKGILTSRPFVSNVEGTAIAFVSSARLVQAAASSSSDCYSWSDVGEDPRATLTNPDNGAIENCTLLGMMPDGRPIFKDTSGDSYNGLILVGSGETNGGSLTSGLMYPVQLSAPASSATSFNASSPDGSLAYVTTAYPLGAVERGGAANVYGVTVPAFGRGSLLTPGSGGENTVVCLSCQVGGGGAASYIGQSADGSRVFFKVAEGSGESPTHPYKGLWSWDRQSETATRLTTATDVEQLVISENGQFAAGLTKQLAGNPHGTADVYEFSASFAQPRLLTSGTSSDTYLLTSAISQESPTKGGVSNDGSGVVYDDEPASIGGVTAPVTVQEWNDGETRQLSPLGATVSYYALGAGGPQLEDVFFVAHEPLVPIDENAGTQTIYDARAGGGFPKPAEPNCEPLAEGCQGQSSPAPTAGAGPGSQGFNGPGNEPTPRPAKQPKPKQHRPKHHRKRKAHDKRHRTRHADTDRRVIR